MRRKKERITIKSEEEIRLMREAGKILAEVHNRLGEIIEPGISTLEIDRKGEEWIREFGCIPSFLNYEGYPASICVSLDDEVVHGIPKENVILREGDIVSLDAGVIYRGYHSDAARTHAVGKISENDQKLIEVTKQSFFGVSDFDGLEHGLEDAAGGGLGLLGVGLFQSFAHIRRQVA